MQTVPWPVSAWKQLKQGHISCEEALSLVRDDEGTLNLGLLDEEVCSRFFQYCQGQKLPPVVPLLLWQSCFYLGSPVEVSSEVLETIGDRTLTTVKVIPISAKSYRAWYHTRTADLTRITSSRLLDPITGKQSTDDIGETTELFLSKAEGQIERIKAIISSALQHQASDIHLEPTLEGLRVRYRIDGVLRDITLLPGEISRRVVVALKVMANMDIADSRRPQDGRIGEKYQVDNEADQSMDMRVSTLPCVCGEKAVVRLLPRENPFTTIDKLGFSPKALKIYKTWLEQPQGIIVFTGPTGSGKTSTLYTSLQAIATEHVNVVTVEDPVEYVLPRITQTQVNEAAGMSFAAGLRSILRQDPDIIMVGEVRDHETAETAIRAALTGHLVFTTLHTNDAAGAIPRIKDIGPDPGLISDALLGVVAQRLVRRICPHCAEPTQPNPELLAILQLDAAQIKKGNWRRGRGCPSCFQSGYSGREAVVEMLEVDDRMRELIYDGTMTQLRRHLSKSDSISFRTSAIEKVMAGVTTVEEVLRVLPRSALKLVSTGEPEPLHLVQRLG
ncbi:MULTISPECIES: GspE/PulE family protein [Cyanophyceae]|uniref:GspE/PulE family protein n=1 Tax=Cyanophyceae TaxID=3028117 RepID=UPI0016852FCB|nr:MULTISPECIES: GspE/PulE family protein [Cyanophyceae]MBD1915460.1 type II/IV secretion system protein [Phormidium sp. FACHB-77]MBD2028531.1 type II/IV secretion system protein [Phormidium sp. FACHB-322]MBD2051071.1 type II/IV secretion system protein [Leptolyngbya sp. FACHB-60]